MIKTFALAVFLTSVVAAQRSVTPLTDANCRSEVLAVSLQGMDIHARCEASGAERVMHLAVTNWAAEDAGLLSAFSIGFCGKSVVSATAPPGWLVKIDEGRDDVVIWWDLPEESAVQLGIPSHARVGRFTVRLRPGWRQSLFASVRWDSSGAGTATTHDCLNGDAA
jgi:hypothetical protein